ncbi:MAG: nicotinate-nucleotide adenylyltransferase [Clostridiales bacterium]|jgi:nicotinate-nucleotide adenylyltransferase|nr:nicotinate-nucleotide adenylyltransferase [Clostridiales bacterium]
MKKIGIMGGTFNPVHNAHLVLAECSYEQFGLDTVWFMPSKNPPHKCGKNIESQEHRSNMIKRGIEDNPHFQFSDFELRRQGLTYTVDTLTMLSSMYDDTTFYFIMGEDSLFALETWKKPDQLFKLAKIIIARRGFHDNNLIMDRIEYLENKYQTNDINLLESPISNLSSELIRKSIKEGKSIKYYVPQKVEEYIYQNKLYVDDRSSNGLIKIAEQSKRKTY